MKKFTDLGLSKKTLEALEKKGFEYPTEIQEKAIPIIIEDKKDIVGYAATGTGKTAAFSLPLLEHIDEKKHHVQAVILTPTRELALQITEEISSFLGDRKIKVAPIYGGQSIVLQMKKLKEGAQIVVGTPGRIIDHIGRKKLKMENLKYFVLDEADEMLNMGFVEEIEQILESTPKEKRVLLFSATMPDRILKLSEKYMGEYEKVSAAKPKQDNSLTDQIYFEVNQADKFEALSRIIDMEEEFYGFIFCRTKVNADKVARRLIERGYPAEGIHGDIPQNKRETIFKRFRDKKVEILVATDVAARGIDVTGITHVINYSLPQDQESYTHRIGRTGRAGKTGTAITFITPYEYRKFNFIGQTRKNKIRKEELPKVEDIIKMKKEKIKNEIVEILDEKNFENFRHFAQMLLDEYPAEDILPAVLKHAFKNDLDAERYQSIESPQSAMVDRKGKTRLFIAKGKKHGFNEKLLSEYIEEVSGVKANQLHDLRLYEDFAFVNVSFALAEEILDAFKVHSKGSKSIVVKAKATESNRRGRGRNSGSSGRSSRGGSRGGSRRGGKKFPSRKNFGRKRR